MDKVEVKFGEWFGQGFNLYKENFGVLVLASLIAWVLGAVTLGILLGPMLAGIYIICLGLIDKKEPKPVVGDLFKGFQYFLNSFLFIFVWGVLFFVVASLLMLVPCIGQVATVVLVYVVQAFLMFGLFLIVDKEMDFCPASMESYHKVKSNLWLFLAVAVVAGLIGGIGAVACGIGMVITFPIQACIFTVAYRDVFRDGEISSQIEESPPAEADTDEKNADDKNIDTET